MAASDLTAAQVMAKSASLLNDTARTNYTYAAQLPYLQIALQELQEMFELNGIPVTQLTSAVIQINAGVTEIVYNAAGTPTNPSLPDDFVEPQQLWERLRDTNPYAPMFRRDYLPHGVEDIQRNSFIYFVWQDQKIIVLPSIQNNDIKIDYIKQLFENLVDENSLINIVNARTFLEYRTAALCAEFIERNLTSAGGLNNYAVLGLDRVTGISSKSKQTIMTRRRPFRSGYKRRGNAW
jgi:hypothetical protein